MPEIEYFRKLPIVVPALLWDETNLSQLDDFTGNMNRVSAKDGEFKVWNGQEQDWISCPAGHRVVKGPLGDFHPVSPEHVAKAYEPAAGPGAEDMAAEGDRYREVLTLLASADPLTPAFARWGVQAASSELAERRRVARRALDDYR